MEKIKDFFYEKSDVFFASLVVVVAIGVIMYNLNGWLVIDSEASRYQEIPLQSQEVAAEEQKPEQAPAESAKPEESKTETTPAETKPEETKAAETKPEETKPAETKPTQTKPAETKPAPAAVRKITVASGSSAKSIANALKNQGLINSTDDFLNKLVASGKETKLQAGTFSIPEGSSLDQIIGILTK